MTDHDRAVTGSPPYRGRKPALHAQALLLRQEGCPVGEIAERLGVAKSTAYQWVRHLPLNPDEATAQRRQAHSKAMTDARWGAYRAARDAARAAEHERAAGVVGALDDRDLLVLGAAIYWCEGSKSKPWRSQDRLEFVNSDPVLLALFLRFLAACQINRAVPRYRLLVHESADAEAAMCCWAERLMIPIERFGRPTLKRHNPTTVRRNASDDYHGCLVITVPRSRALYWRVEGIIAGIRAAVECAGDE